MILRGAKAGLHRVAIGVEKLLSKLSRGPSEPGVIEPYIGYATPDSMILRGRVLSKHRTPVPRDGQGRLANFRQTISFFLTDEVPGVVVRHDSHSTETDEEGYFALEVPRRGSGWQSCEVFVPGTKIRALCEVFVPTEDAKFMVVSDIDDTVLETGAYQLWRNLWTSLTGNSLTRHVFVDAIAMMNRLSEAERNPVFYVSSSPWNFYGFLQEIFVGNGLLRGPMFLRDLGVSEDKFITGTHGDHKSGAIDTILAANPTLPAILIGDTGQHDAEVYLNVIRRHPGRIAAVVLREPGPGPKSAARLAMEEISKTGVPLLHGRSFDGMSPEETID